jgi:flagellar motor switch/type III secretory pathway protein FliN
MTELTPEPMTPEPIGHEPTIQEPMAQSERMLLEAVAALEQADANLRDPGIEPYRLADWSECLDAQKTNENSILPCPLPPDLLANTQASDAHRSADTDLAGSSSLRTDAADAKTEELRIELGRTQLTFRSLYELPEDALLVLDAHAEQLFDLYAGDCRLAKGEILCLDGQICFRVVELLCPASATP